MVLVLSSELLLLFLDRIKLLRSCRVVSSTSSNSSFLSSALYFLVLAIFLINSESFSLFITLQLYPFLVRSSTGSQVRKFANWFLVELLWLGGLGGHAFVLCVLTLGHTVASSGVCRVGFLMGCG